MKRCFRPTNLRDASLAMISQCNTIITRYQAQGLRLTLRQLYYQLVSRNVVPNTERSYKRVGGILSDGRLAGLVDWNAIEDRGRPPIMQSQWRNLEGLAKSALSAYRLPRWAGQEFYVELWVEKQALAGVLEPIAEEFHVPLIVNKGYSSQSAMYESARRLTQSDAPYTEMRTKVVLYMGDHDPSGEDMVRDVRARLEMFDVQQLRVKKIALTTAQVEEFNPPPNPAKMTDSRAEKYVEKHGHNSWEMDALDPEELARIVRREIALVLDTEKMDVVIKREKKDKAALLKAVGKLPDSEDLIEKLEARKDP